MVNMAFDNPTDELINTLNTERTGLQRRLDEINQQIDTYTNMVRREEQKNADMAASLRTMQDNFDKIPREDIRTRYDEAMDAKFRLATMRGQLEQLKATQEVIDNEIALLNDILTKVQGGIEFHDGSANNDNALGNMNNSSSLNIIRIVKAQEDERRRLANQIHDGPAQSLTNFVLQAEICQRLFDRDQETAKTELLKLKEDASVTFQRVRDFISDLRPMMLDDLGVIPTVRKYIEMFSNKTDIKVKHDIAGQEDRRLEEYQEVMLFRGIQDLMGHIRDFADANEIELRVDIQFDHARVVVADNGRFFDAEALMNNEHPDDPRAQGITTLREKFELIGGQLSVTSQEQSGTEVRFEMPVNNREGM